jgi:hypothetical protein
MEKTFMIEAKAALQCSASQNNIIFQRFVKKRAQGTPILKLTGPTQQIVDTLVSLLALPRHGKLFAFSGVYFPRTWFCRTSSHRW